MKKKYIILELVIIIIFFGCQIDHLKNKKNSQKNKQIININIKKSISVKSYDEIDEVIKKNKNFDQLFNSFKKNNYTIDELKDLINQDLNYIKNIQQTHSHAKIDTGAIKSRLVLTEIDLKKLNHLIHKNVVDVDTIQFMLTAVVKDINHIIQHMKIYHFSYDEFDEILTKDSIQKVKYDSIKKENKLKQIPKLKLKKIF